MAEIPNAASVALIAGGRVLLIRRAFPPMAGRWTLPGGRLEPGETPAAAAAREIGEELGLTVGELIEMRQHVVGSYRLAVFAADSFAGTIAPGDEVAEWRWVRPAELAALPTTPGLAEVVAAACERLAGRADIG